MKYKIGQVLKFIGDDIVFENNCHIKKLSWQKGKDYKILNSGYGLNNPNYTMYEISRDNDGTGSGWMSELDLNMLFIDLRKTRKLKLKKLNVN